MSNNSAAAAKAPSFDADRVGDQAGELVTSSIHWASTHWFQIAVAFGIGLVLALVLLWLRSLGPRLARRSASGKGWPAIIGRAIQRTNTPFIVLLSARLVSGYAGAPANVSTTIDFLFTVAMVFQAAV